MKWLRVLRTAIRALRRNIMRAVLTTLGIIIGIAAVIAMMAIGGGSAKMLQKTIAAMGASNVMVMPGAAASSGVSWGTGTSNTLTPDDCDAIGRECPAVKAAAPVVRSGGQLIVGNRNWTPESIIGTTAEYLIVRDWPLSEGDVFSDRDVRNGAKVCLVGQTIVRELFGKISPIGKDLRIQNVTFKIVGVLSSKGANMMGSDQDNTLIAPWTTIKFRVTGTSTATGASSGSSSSATSDAVNSLSNLYPDAAVALYPAISSTEAADTPLPVRFTTVGQIMLAARSAPQIPDAMEQVTQLLHERHRIREGKPDDFNLRDMTEISSMLSSTNRTMSNLLFSVALISLLVGGVGIMNIMLVSVTERTREIGLRMAVGARGNDILTQFLIEALVLCIAGGLLGIVLGVTAAKLVTMFLNWQTELSAASIVISIFVSASVGLIFGFYPAWKAARLDPIQALRYE